MKCGQALLGLGLFALLAAGCSGSSPPVGVACQVNTDCKNPLSCTFGKCHTTCREARDCPDGHRCVAGPEGAVCQLESKCAYLSDCPLPLVCALDRQCRNECREDRDCATKTQKCVKPDFVCAEPEEIAASGTGLKASQNAPVPAAPPGVDASPRPDAQFADAAPAADGGAPDAPTTDGASPDAAAASPDLPRDVNLGDIPVGPCGFQDPNEPTNDVRETAAVLAPGVAVQGCIAGKAPTGENSDSDWFELVTPDDVTGGYFQVAISDVGPDRVGVTTYLASDNTIIFDGFGAPDPGASLNFFFSAAPGQHYRLLVAYGTYDFIYKVPFRYTIKATYTKVNDTYEPNDTRATAKPIALGTPVTALAFAGFTTGRAGFGNGRGNPVWTADWYKVEVAAGMLKATVENAAADVRVGLLVYDSLGTERGRADSVTYGAGATLTVPSMPGTYYLQVLATDLGPVMAGTGTSVSPSFTMPYTLTLSQP